MKRFLWVVLAIVLSTGVYFTIRYGLRPKPIPILNPTQFANAEQVGAVIYRRMRQVIRQERIVVLGSLPELVSSTELWNGFLKTATADKVKIDVFYQWPNLPTPEFAQQLGVRAIDEASVASGEFIKQVHQSVQRGHLVVIHTITQESTHLHKDSLTRRLDRLPNNPVLSLSILKWSVHEEGIEMLENSCQEGARLNCAAYRLGRKFLKKKLDPSLLWAAMERHGLKEYLIFIHQSE